jgi:hypothetical protein
MPLIRYLAPGGASTIGLSEFRSRKVSFCGDARIGWEQMLTGASAAPASGDAKSLRHFSAPEALCFL